MRLSLCVGRWACLAASVASGVKLYSIYNAFISHWPWVVCLYPEIDVRKKAKKNIRENGKVKDKDKDKGKGKG